MKRLVSLLVLAALLLSGCAGIKKEPEKKKYEATFLTVFDTVTTVIGWAESQESFQATSQAVHDELLRYHQLFDIYNEYEGISNLKTVNDNAGIQPVVVDWAILNLLRDCKTYYDLTGGRVNVAMGSVLYLWHEARDQGINDPANAKLPDMDALKVAAEHVSMDDVILDEAASTVYLADPQMRLDVGAVAKGWSVQRVCENAPEGLLLSVGGNVCATGPKDEAGTPWTVGVQNPDGGNTYLHTLYLTRGSMVTSGDYQRAYSVDGKLYHHIIDPDTLYPSTYWRSVTIICDDSGLADALSTALFLLPFEEGEQLLEETGAEALWADGEGNLYYSDGFQELIRT